MPITVEQVQEDVLVTIMSIQGELDASNYLEVIAQANMVYKAGSRCLLIDLSEISFMASSGLVSLYSIARIFQGKQPPDPEEGWETFHSIDRSKGAGVQENVKLINPQPSINEILKNSGMKEFFEIYSDLDMALTSFK